MTKALRLIPLLTGLVLLLAAGGRAMAGPIYQQPSDFPGGFGVASQTDASTGNPLFIAYDNFTLTQAAQATGLTWQGLYFNPPQLGPIESFTITFYDNNPSNQPGMPIASPTITGTNAGESFVGLDSNDLPTYNYAAALAQPIAFQPNKTYWLSIVPTLNVGFEWAWHTGTGGDGRAVQDVFDNNGQLLAREEVASDLAFELVPQPDGLTLLGVGAFGLLCYGWCRVCRRGPVTRKGNAPGSLLVP
jgi:hypothetical protein